MHIMKILKIFAALFFLILTTTTFAQKTEIRDVTGFSGVDVSEGIKVELTFGDKEFVEVTADEEYIDQVMTVVSGDELDIYLKGNNWKGGKRNILVKVTASKVNLIEASSGSSVTSQNLIESDELEMSVSSGANIKIAFKAPKASCDASSGANAKLKGVTKYFSADASSGAGISAFEVKAVNVKADVSSGAHVYVHAEKEIDANASSGGSIKYTGNPEIVDVDKSSGGSIRKK